MVVGRWTSSGARQTAAGSASASDAAIIELCLAVFPWAHYRRRDAAIKLHMLLDLRGSIPSVVQITPGKCPDVAALDHLVLEAGAIYIMDRGYVDFERLHRFCLEAAFFVTRTNQGIQFTRRSSQPIDAWTRLISDHIVVLATRQSRRLRWTPLSRQKFGSP